MLDVEHQGKKVSGVRLLDEWLCQILRYGQDKVGVMGEGLMGLAEMSVKL